MNDILEEGLSKRRSVVLVWDYSRPINPEFSQVARRDQLLGTHYDQLAEIAGRICYDSLGSGRDSREYHEHIQQVGHYSVYEHCVMSILVAPNFGILMDLFGRPGVWLEPTLDGLFRLDFNPRVLLDWDKIRQNRFSDVYDVLASCVNKNMEFLHIDCNNREYAQTYTPWRSLWLRGSRGFSHEQVRHGDFTAISQRSTRYVDESTSEMCYHPLVKHLSPQTKRVINELIPTLQGVYSVIVDELIGVHTPIKQARGCARGILPNWLSTEMIFSASLAQWQRMIQMRHNPAADLEINDIYHAVIECLGV